MDKKANHPCLGDKPKTHKIKLSQINYGFRNKSENVISVHCAVMKISALLTTMQLTTSNSN